MAGMEEENLTNELVAMVAHRDKVIQRNIELESDARHMESQISDLKVRMRKQKGPGLTLLSFIKSLLILTGILSTAYAYWAVVIVGGLLE